LSFIDVYDVVSFKRAFLSISKRLSPKWPHICCCCW